MLEKEAEGIPEVAVMATMQTVEKAAEVDPTTLGESYSVVDPAVRDGEVGISAWPFSLPEIDGPHPEGMAAKWGPWCAWSAYLNACLFS